MSARFAFICMAFLLACSAALAQPSFEYNPVKDDSLDLVRLKTEIRKQYEKDSLSINGENKKYILEVYRERFKDLDELFASREPISATAPNTFLTGIANEIISKNPALKQLSPRIIFSRGWWPNAYSTGEGTIVFNIDLFVKLQNESQVAFVLCHELAHLYLDHGNKKILKYITTLYSDEYQQKLKALKKQQFDKKQELDKLEMGIAFKSFRHSRDSESEADSIAIKFMKNTGYDCKESLTCLGLLDEIDEEKIDFTTYLPKIFSFSSYPFKKRWIEKESAFFGVTADNKEKKPIDDSLKTHPDCKVRIKNLDPLFEQWHISGGRQFLQDKQQFNLLQQQFSFEEARYCFDRKKVSRCLFNTLCLLDKFPGNAYLATLTGKCFNELFNKQKAHKLNTIAELPSPFREKNYNTLLELIGRLSLTDIAAIGFHFLNQYSSAFSGNAEFNKVLEEAKKNYESMNRNDIF